MQTENIAIKESENGKVIACDHEVFVIKIATNFSEKYKNRFEFFHKKFSEIKSVIKALKNKKLVVLYLI